MNTHRSFLKSPVIAIVIYLSLLFTSCSVNVKEEKDRKNVEINTPFGGLKVRTNQAEAQKDVGIALYPGARPVTKENSNNEKNANVNITMPWLSLKIVALEFESDDASDKILSFYRQELTKYGRVLECKGAHFNKESFHHDADRHGNSRELTCDSDRSDSKSVELKVGTSDRFRLVGIGPKGNGTKFALVYVQTRDKSDTI